MSPAAGRRASGSGAVRWTGRPIFVAARPILNGYTLAHAGLGCDVRVFTRRQADLAALMLERAETEESKVLLCPMPGLVKAIHVAEGQVVKVGDPLCLIEAMKMENVLRAERDGTIKSIEAREGRVPRRRCPDPVLRMSGAHWFRVRLRRPRMTPV